MSVHGSRVSDACIAEVIEGAEPAIRIHPARIVTWGLDQTGRHRTARSLRRGRILA